MASQFLVLHRTRARGLAGPEPITLQSCLAYLEFWPQWDALKFVEIMLLTDQLLLDSLAAEKRTKETKENG